MLYKWLSPENLLRRKNMDVGKQDMSLALNQGLPLLPQLLYTIHVTLLFGADYAILGGIMRAIKLFCMSLLIFPLIFLMAFPSVSSAIEVSAETARRAAVNWLSALGAESKLPGGVMPSIVGEEYIRVDGNMLGYNFLLSPTGHILMNARGELQPVRLYSLTSTLSVNRETGPLNAIKGEMQRVGKVLNAHEAELSRINLSATRNGQLWTLFDRENATFQQHYQAIRKGRVTPLSAISLGPLLTTQWDQGWPYNIYTPRWYNGPTDNMGDPTATGCVATSAAQIMKYWNYPKRGISHDSYTWFNGKADETLSGTFCANRYDWSFMTDTYNQFSSSDSANAVALIMSDAGLAFHMDYGKDASSAHGIDGAIVLPKFFGYRNTAQAVHRYSYASDSEWMQVFKQEVQNSRPSMFSIYDPDYNGKQVGHNVVVDGYQDTPSEQIHINVGWAGSYNGWYLPSNLDLGNYSFSDVASQSAVIGIEPSPPALIFKVPESGQTTCYDNWGTPITCFATGQDGAYTINTLNYTDNGDGTVRDNNTGLVWQKQDNGSTYNWYEASGVYHATENPTTLDYCGSLALGGNGVWRLPTKNELTMIVDFSSPDPNIPLVGPSIRSDYFPNTQKSWYWAAAILNDPSAVLSPPTNYAVNFGGGYNGFAAGYLEKSERHYIRCVRGENTPSAHRYVDCSTNGAPILDLVTNLEWQKSYEGNDFDTPRTWGSALAYCRGLSNNGFTDWRLPTIKELATLTVESDYKLAPLRDQDLFAVPNYNASYWSSTTVTNENKQDAWSVLAGKNSGYGMDIGLASHAPSGPQSLYVRCVRGGLPEFRLTVSKSGDGTGHISSYPYNGIKQCDSTCSAVFPMNKSVALHAVASPGMSAAWDNCTAVGGVLTGIGTPDVVCELNNADGEDMPVLTAVFTRNLYTVTATAGANGSLDSLTPSPVNVYYADNGPVFKFTANPGYHVSGVTSTCGNTVYSNTSNGVSSYTYTTDTVYFNCQVTATFAQNIYSIAGVVTSGSGTLTCLPATVTINQFFMCTIAASPSFYVSALTDNGISVLNPLAPLPTKYGLTGVNKDHLVNVTFKEYPVIKLGSGPLFYSLNFMDAYNAAADGDIIESLSGSSEEILNLKRNVSIILKGGFSSGYVVNTGFTTVKGPFTISSGSVRLQKISIK